MQLVTSAFEMYNWRLNFRTFNISSFIFLLS